MSLGAESQVVIAGAGITGLSAAHHLRQRGFRDYLVVEAEAEAGGIVRSIRLDGGFSFDPASFSLYTQSAYVARLYREWLGENSKPHRRDAWIFSHGVFTRYPFQAKLHGLPLGIVAECLIGYLRAGRDVVPSVRSFDRWLVAAFGSGMARHFMIPFNQKHWKWPLDQMTASWVRDYVVRPRKRDVLRGALAPSSERFGINAAFLYPRRGGIGVLPQSMFEHLGEDQSRFLFNARIESVDLESRTLGLADGRALRYRHLVYTLPLPILSDLVRDLPPSVESAIQRLEYSRLHTLFFAIPGPPLTRWMRLYLPEPEILPHRLGFPQAVQLESAPPGWGTLYAEITEARRPKESWNEEAMVRKTLDDLRRIGVVPAGDHVEYKGRATTDPAYVIFTRTHAEDVRIIRGFLLEYGVLTAGRYGDWRYYAIDHSLLSGRSVVHRILDGKA